MNWGLIDRLLGAEPPDPLPIDTLWFLLSSERRRTVIEHLATSDDGLTKRELAEALAFLESDAEHPDDVDRSEVKSIYVSLHQTHLGELEAAGAIELENRGHLVRPTPLCDQLASIVREVRKLNGGPQGGQEAPVHA